MALAASTGLYVALGMLASAALIVGIVLLTRRMVRQLTTRNDELIAREFAGTPIERQSGMANFFGLESKGGKQLRGNGALVVTADRVWFQRIGAGEPIVIPRRDVKAAEVVSSHAGKTVGRPLLKLTFDDEHGGTDAVAWYVPDAEAWAAALAPKSGPVA